MWKAPYEQSSGCKYSNCDLSKKLIFPVGLNSLHAGEQRKKLVIKMPTISERPNCVNLLFLQFGQSSWQVGGGNGTILSQPDGRNVERFNRTIDIMRWQVLKQLRETDCPTMKKPRWFRSWNPDSEDRLIPSDFKCVTLERSPWALSIMTHVTSKICQICHYFHRHLSIIVNPSCCDSAPQVHFPIFFRESRVRRLNTSAQRGITLLVKNWKPACTRLSDALIRTKTQNTLRTAWEFQRVNSLKFDPISNVFTLKNFKRKNSNHVL